MPTLTDTDILDLVTTTQKELGPPVFQQIAQNLVDYEVMGKWLRKDKVMIDSGIGIQRTMMVNLPDAAKHVGLADVDDVDIPTLLTNINIPWRHATVNWGFERRELLMNRGKALITKVVQPRRVGAMINLAEVLEAKAWSCPASTDTVLPYGIPYWVVMNSSTGFCGTVDATNGHTTVGGLNPTNYPKWRNYTGTYSAVSKADLIKKLRTAHRKIRWKSPITLQDYRGSKGERYRIFLDEATLSAIEDLGEAQNENLGRDIASMDDQMVFRKHPIVWVPQLDETPVASHPIYLIDHSTFYPVVLSGDYLRETDPEKKSDQHNVFVVFVDLSYNYLCIDRRRNAAFYMA